MQIAAMNRLLDEMRCAILKLSNGELEIAKEQIRAEGKPEEIVEKIAQAGNMQISNGPKKALKEKLQAQNYLLEADKETIAKEIISTFDQLMLLKEVEKLIVDSEKRLNKEHLKVVKAIENGMAIPYDRDKIKLAMLELEAKKG
ncbi:hypothetical protein FQR65_LT15608 [Abscondita terminalis]|nr:hypothetical protein FQR65_LT15608 [Abscondita terminalis]